MEEERGEGQAAEPSADHSRLPGWIWQSSWGLRIAVGMTALLAWVGATSVSSSPPAVTGTPVSPSVTTPVMAPSGRTTPPALAPTTGPSLPQQPLDITYDYGPGPQPVPGARLAP